MSNSSISQRPIDKVLGSLRGVKPSGNNKWQSLCPSHSDKEASLSISVAQDDKVILHCHAGCDFNEVVRAMGLEPKDLFLPKEMPSKPEKQKKKVVKTYDYEDENLNLVFQVCRTYPKGFYQRRPDGQGGWINNLKETRTVLYRLTRILKYKDRHPVYIVEGEKDADNLEALGLVATTSPMGAGKWKQYYNDWLIDADVIIIPDNDTPGKKHAAEIADKLHFQGKGAKSVKVVELPGLPEKNDISDWLFINNNNKDKLIETVTNTPDWKEIRLEYNSRLSSEIKKDLVPAPEGKGEKLIIGNPFGMSDLGNAERLVRLEGHNLRYCSTLKKWYYWDEHRWKQDDTGIVIRKTKQTIRSIYKEASEIIDDDTRKALTKFALKSESVNRIEAAIKLAQSEPGIPITINQLDADSWKLNVLNGTINLMTGELEPDKREDLMTKMAPIEYKGLDMRLELWDKFLERILPDKELREFVQRAAGYSITGLASEEKLFFAWGPPATGKSTFLNTLSAVLGDYAATSDFETFLARDRSNGGPRNDIARLANKRFVQSLEVDEGKKLAEGLVKSLTGGDVITARFLYGESFEFLPTFKLWLSANSRPRVREDDAAMWRRILQLPFDQQIPEAERDPQLKLTLRNTEISGPAIMAWLVKGCLEWQRKGLAIPEIVKQTTEDYRQEMDPLKDFIEEECRIHPLVRVKVAELYKAYEAWCHENGEKYPLSRKGFKKKLEARGMQQIRDNHRKWQGIGLLDDKQQTYSGGLPVVYADDDPY